MPSCKQSLIGAKAHPRGEGKLAATPCLKLTSHFLVSLSATREWKKRVCQIEFPFWRPPAVPSLVLVPTNPIPKGDLLTLTSQLFAPFFGFASWPTNTLCNRKKGALVHQVVYAIIRRITIKWRFAQIRLGQGHAVHVDCGSPDGHSVSHS